MEERTFQLLGNLMVTKQFTGPPDVADVRRADSLAREIFWGVADK